MVCGFVRLFGNALGVLGHFRHIQFVLEFVFEELSCASVIVRSLRCGRSLLQFVGISVAQAV